MLEIPEFKSKTWWVNVAFEVDCCYRNQGVTKLYSFKESKFHDIFLICGHMAQNPYFPADRKMCLMGDIQVSIKFSMSNDVHLLRRGIRILSHTLFEILIFQWLKILPFQAFHAVKSLQDVENFHHQLFEVVSSSFHFGFVPFRHKLTVVRSKIKNKHFCPF